MILNLFLLLFFLQGALVDKSNYSKYASTVASYGFTVVVPNHINDNFTPPGFPEGLYAEQQQVNQVLNYVKSENEMVTHLFISKSIQTKWFCSVIPMEELLA
ncbi:MAG: hypothetical protein HC764_24900 [Pleurocapsa sp. CRU_1_2]|nr:hypothetical protein [Pleurocapsa sp. CRU_1_2]